MAKLIQNNQIVPSSGFSKIFTSNVPISLTGTATETTVLSFTIPANTMLANSCLDMDFLFETTLTNNLRVFRVYIGGIIVATFAVQNIASAAHRRILVNRNIQTTQIMLTPGLRANNSIGNFNAVPVQTNIDFTIDKLVTMTTQLNNTTDAAIIHGATFLVY